MVDRVGETGCKTPFEGGLDEGCPLGELFLGPEGGLFFGDLLAVGVGVEGAAHGEDGV